MKYYHVELYVISRIAKRFFIGLDGALSFPFQNSRYLIYSDKIEKPNPLTLLGQSSVENYSIRTPSGYNLLNFNSKLICIIATETEFNNQHLFEEHAYVFKELQFIIDLLSFLMPFPASAVNLNNYFRLSSFGFGEVNESERFKNEKRQKINPIELGKPGTKIYEKLTKDYLLTSKSTSKLANLLSKYPHLRSGFRLARRAKETYLDGNVSESIALEVSAIESLYCDRKTLFKNQITIIRKGKIMQKAATFKEFIRNNATNKKKLEFITKINAYDRRSKYLHQGKIKDIDEERTTYSVNQDDYVALQSMHFALQNFILKKLV